MKRILGIAMVLSLVAFIAGCSKEKAGQIKAESASEKFETASNEKDITKEPTKKDSSGKEEVIDLGKGVKLELVLVPAGKFKMGSNKNPIDPFSNIEVYQPPEYEVPQHEVTLTRPFYMGKYEVTQEQWFEIMGENPSKQTKGRKLPVTEVSWDDCQEFIKKLNGKTKGGYRLPTEAEWEYACRAGTSTAYSFGDRLTKNDANIDGDSIKEVGSYKPNAFGLYDMHGNVFEWCEDRWGEYSADAVTDPKGPATGWNRAKRGGYFFSYEPGARSSFRALMSPNIRSCFYGFRLARAP